MASIHDHGRMSNKEQDMLGVKKIYLKYNLPQKTAFCGRLKYQIHTKICKNLSIYMKKVSLYLEWR